MNARSFITKRIPRALRMFAGGAVLLVGLRFALWLAVHFVALPEGLRRPGPESIEIVDRNGKPLREVPQAGMKFARPVSLDAMPRALVAATLAAEDKRFWNHSGVDWCASARAARDLVRHRRIVSGGSTITQQLIKIAAPRPRTFATKLIEAAQAMRLEQVWSKERILAEYLNRLDYGELCFGSAAAAEHFFGKPVNQLSSAEAALLAGLPQSPARLNPHRHPEPAEKRQRWVLERMNALGFIDRAELARASGEPLRVRPTGRPFRAPHFVDLLRQQERELFRGAGGGRIRTSLDLELNVAVETALRSRLAALREQHVGDAAAVVIDNRTGEVLALVGSENFFAPAAGQVNGAWARRSAGSALKPFTYLLAIEAGATPATIIADVPTEFPTPTGIFRPANYNQHCAGPVRLRHALANSLNIPAVRTLADLGGAELLQRRLQACGLTTLERPAAHYGLGLTIGNAEVRLLELANAYASLARLGEWRPWRLTAAEGADERGVQIADADVAWLIADILSDNAARAAAFGVESSLRFDFPVACKTGTSSDFRDNWAFGYTPEFTVGVWAGNFDGTPMQGVAGVTGAAPILNDIFSHLHRRRGTTWFATPTNIVARTIHPLTGRVVAATREGAVKEKFIAGREPAAERAEDYDESGRVILGREFTDWISTGDNWLAGRVSLAGAIVASGVRLVSPLPGTTFFLDPDLPGDGSRVRLRADGAGKIRWRSESLECREENGESIAILREGRHRLAASAESGGASAETWILVKRL